MKRQLINQVDSHHARIVLQSRGGPSTAQTAEHWDCTPTWVRQILHCFNADGIEAIAWYPTYCSGAGPRKSVAEVAEQRSRVIRSPVAR